MVGNVRIISSHRIVVVVVIIVDIMMQKVTMIDKKEENLNLKMTVVLPKNYLNMVVGKLV